MNRIYTKTGDRGTTGIHGGTRVPKDDIRIEANGTLDELNCQLGIVRSMLRCPVKPGMTEEVKPGMTESERSDGRYLAQRPFLGSKTDTRAAERASYDDILHDIQKNLMTVMSQVATPAAEREKNPNELPENLVANCEATMDALTAEAGPSRHFLLPGGTLLAAQLQLARAICRRAERRLWTLHRQDPPPAGPRPRTHPAIYQPPLRPAVRHGPP